MTKLDLYRLLAESDKKNPLWIDAFKMYEEANNKLDGIGCRSCRTKVLKWLRRG